jgi:hypothetical protein
MGRIVNHVVKSLECRRQKEEISNYKLSYNFEVQNRRIEDKILKIDYVFTISYNEEVGEIIVVGSLGYKDTSKLLKTIDGNWEQKIDVQKRIYNVIYRNALFMVMDLSRHLGLPPPVFLPEITPGGQEQ